MIDMLGNNLSITHVSHLLTCKFLFQKHHMSSKNITHLNPAAQEYTQFRHTYFQLPQLTVCHKSYTHAHLVFTNFIPFLRTLLSHPTSVIQNSLQIYYPSNTQLHKRTLSLFQSEVPYLLQYLCIYKAVNCVKLCCYFYEVTIFF